MDGNPPHASFLEITPAPPAQAACEGGGTWAPRRPLRVSTGSVVGRVGLRASFDEPCDHSPALCRKHPRPTANLTAAAESKAGLGAGLRRLLGEAQSGRPRGRNEKNVMIPSSPRRHRSLNSPNHSSLEPAQDRTVGTARAGGLRRSSPPGRGEASNGTPTGTRLKPDEATRSLWTEQEL